MKLFNIFLCISFCLLFTQINGQSDTKNGKTNIIVNDSLILSNTAIGGNLFIGTGVFNGNLSNHFTNPFLLGINVDFIRNNIYFSRSPLVVL
jgi:hypothetical protein